MLPMACGPSQGALRTDVEAYLSRAATWAPVENETAHALERILATEFVDETEVLHQLADARPRVEGHLARARGYTPATKSVTSVHSTYLRSWENLLSGFDAIEAGFRTGDYSRLASGRDAMARWRDGLLTVASQLRELKDRTGADPPPIESS